MSTAEREEQSPVCINLSHTKKPTTIHAKSRHLSHWGELRRTPSGKYSFQRQRNVSQVQLPTIIPLPPFCVKLIQIQSDCLQMVSVHVSVLV